jgi:predicted Rdx family selenoprotein
LKHFGVLMTNNESYFASLHFLMRAILMAQRTLAAGFADTGIEKAAAKSASAGKYKISVNPVILSNFSSCLGVLVAIFFQKKFDFH